MSPDSRSKDQRVWISTQADLTPESLLFSLLFLSPELSAIVESSLFIIIIIFKSFITKKLILFVETTNKF